MALNFFLSLALKEIELRGAWVVPSVERQALNFGSGPDLRVLGWRPANRLCTVGMVLEDSLSLPLCLPLPRHTRVCERSLSQNKYILKK